MSRTYTSYLDSTADVPLWNQTPPLVFTAAQSQYSTIYWPWILEKQGLPFAGSGAVSTGNFVMYYSTDHGAGGIAVATANEPEGPWTNRGQVYSDTVAGTSTETPSVWYDSNSNIFRMLYQQAGAVAGSAQSTLQATSTNGNTWTRRPVAGTPTRNDGAIIIAPGEWPGDGHSGYAVVMDGYLPGEKIAYHLAGGGNTPHFGRSYSVDYGETWRQDPSLLMYGQNKTKGVMANSRIEWNSGHVFRIGNRKWWIGLVSNFSSGGGATSRHICQAVLSEDGRRLLGAPQRIFSSGGPADYRSLFLLSRDGTFYLYYTVDKTEMYMTSIVGRP